MLVVASLLILLTSIQQDTVYSKDPYLQIQVDIFGNVLTSENFHTNILLFPGQEALRTKSVQEELEVVEHQIVELRTLYAEVDKRRRHYATTIGPRPLSAKESDELIKVKNEFEGKLKHILLDHQLKRLKEVNNYILLRKMGVKAFVEEFAKTQKINFDKPAFSRSFKRVREETQDLAKAKAETFSDQLLNVLDERQKESLRKLLPELKTTNLEFLFLDLSSTKDEAKTKSSDSSKEVLELVKRISSFRMTNDGSWEKGDHQGQSNYFSSNILANLISEDPKKFPELDIRSAQLLELEELLQVHQQQLLDLRTDFSAARRNSSQMHQANEIYRQEKKKIQNEFVERFARVIPETQLDRIRPRLSRSCIVANGLFSELTRNKWLQEELNVSEKQLNDLKSRIDGACEQTSIELRTLEKNALAEILSSLPAILRENLEESLGDVPIHISPSPHLVIR